MLHQIRAKKSLHQAMLAVAITGFFASFLTPGWWLAFGFGIMLLYLWRYAPNSPAITPTNKMAEPFQQKRRDEPDTYRSIEWKNMIFRSNTEIRIAKTLDHRGIFFIPPTRVRMSAGKDGRQSRELDFVICHEGKWGVLEVDGPYHNAKLDAERDNLLCTHGIRSIQRFSADRCYNAPQTVIDEFLHVLEHQ